MRDNSSSSFIHGKSYPKHDAYRYLTKDPNEEWTTLLSLRKGRKPLFLIFLLHYLLVLASSLVSRCWRTTYTKLFCIPGLRLPSMMKAKTNATNSPSAGQRMKVYLPHPSDSADAKCLTTNKNSMNETEQKRCILIISTKLWWRCIPIMHVKLKTIIFDFSRQKAWNYTSQRSQHRASAMAPYRPPSPIFPSQVMQQMFIWRLISKEFNFAILRWKGFRERFSVHICGYMFECNIFIWYSYLGSADARVLRHGTCWESTVVVLWGKMLTVN